MIRKTDKIGRVVIPLPYRTALNIKEHDNLELTLSKDQIVIKKPAVECVFCGNDKDLEKFSNLHICQACADHLQTRI